MSHREVFNKFKNLMPIYGDKVVKWFPNGPNRIRVELSTHEVFIFSWHKDGSWRFETLSSFLESMKGAK